MANRHLLRTTVLQTLYEWDFRNCEKLVSEILERNMEEVSGKDIEGFASELAVGVEARKKEIDAVIAKAAPDWPIEKVSIIDRNILRIGLFELLFSDRGEVPPKVAINEAIELAKTFGSPTSSRFVNGVLGAVYREMGEPEKQQTSKRIKNVNLPDDRVPAEELAGAVVYCKNEGRVMLALVHDVFGHWTLSKGGVKEGETADQTVFRDIKEELGIEEGVVEGKVGENYYIAYDPEKGKIRKEVNYYLVQVPYCELIKPDKPGIDEVRWFELDEVSSLNFYKDIIPVIEESVKKLIASEEIKQDKN